MAEDAATRDVARSGSMTGARLYFRLIEQSVKAQLQYRASFLLMTVGHFVTTVVEASGIWALFDRFGGLQQWSLAEVAFLYGLVNCVFAIAESVSRGFDLFGTLFVKTGNFDRVLLRPRSTVLQLAGHELQLYRIGRFLQGLLIMGWAVWTLEVAWPIWKFGLLVATVGCGVLFFYGLFVIQATLSFWATESLEIMNTLTYGGVETAQYPMTIYRRPFRRFFTFVVPLGCISYFPAMAILEVAEPLGTPVWLQICAPLAGVAFFLVALVIWSFGVRYYTSTGS